MPVQPGAQRRQRLAAAGAAHQAVARSVLRAASGAALRVSGSAVFRDAAGSELWAPDIAGRDQREMHVCSGARRGPRGEGCTTACGSIYFIGWSFLHSANFYVMPDRVR